MRRHGKLRLLITGRFDSLNWSNSHVRPLALTPCVGEIIAVTDGPLITSPKIVREDPPEWLRKVLSRSIARSVWTIRTAMKRRPHVVMGYYFFPGALSALVAARASGAHAIFQSSAGLIEILGAGLVNENPFIPIQSRLTRMLRSLAKRICRHFDSVVVRGDVMRSYMLERAGCRSVHVIPGSVNTEKFRDGQARRDYDLVFVGRLAPIKQPEQILQVVRGLCQERLAVRAAIVGDGPLLEDLRRIALQMGIRDNVDFLGHREDVDVILRRSRVFILTSRTEGLSIAMAEAMACGVVPVVPTVGELGTLVENGRTGWLVPPGDISAYVQRIGSLLRDEPGWRRLSAEARRRVVQNNALAAVANMWNSCLMESAGVLA